MKTRYYYAEFSSAVREYHPGYGDIVAGGIELYRFLTKNSRDQFVLDSKNARAINYKHAIMHREQMKYWREQ